MAGREAIRAQIRDPDPASKIQCAAGQVSAALLLTRQSPAVWVPDLRPAFAGHPSGMTRVGFIEGKLASGCAEKPRQGACDSQIIERFVHVLHQCRGLVGAERIAFA